jgi:branched-chain amino acid transport system ATP-binding protein
MEVNGIGKSFGGVHALSGVSFDVREGEILAIVGPNGSGKTTLYNIISGFVRPDSGKVVALGKLTSGMWPAAIARLGVVRTFQELRLFGDMTVMQNMIAAWPFRESRSVSGSLLARRRWRAEMAEAEGKAIRLLASAGLDGRRDALAGELSYGQQKLVSILRALMTGCRVLLVDEPVAGVNPVMAGEISTLLRELNDKGLTIVLIEHNMDFVRKLAKRALVLRSGSVLALGETGEVLARPEVYEAYLGN